MPIARHLVLIGPMAVGKTTIGSLVADALGWQFLDSDREIERLHGRTGADIASSDGTDALHAIERCVFADMVSRPDPAVVAPAESVVDHPRGRDLLRTHHTVWLDADPSELIERRSHTDHRRSMRADEFERRRRDRRDHLADCSVARFDTTSATPRATADAIVASLLG